ncbi:related to amino acid transporters [Phialocephala subalpina]|uniref:Related to amino acid transporters n=1 Tax=Phialocephala subalpina TaxID=576137 RepID=A0A1L7XIR1_9HELO|nr:related to amino acid transporters [Phialocephala subalpina]
MQNIQPAPGFPDSLKGGRHLIIPKRHLFSTEHVLMYRRPTNKDFKSLESFYSLSFSKHTVHRLHPRLPVVLSDNIIEQSILRHSNVRDVEKLNPDNESPEEGIIDLEEQLPGSSQAHIHSHAGTQRHLRNYQVTMIGFCSSIGVGLFVGTGFTYAKAGPAGLLLAYLIVGSVVWCVMQSIDELATVFPTAGTSPHWATRFIDPSVGFSLAMSYTYCYAIAIASEVSAAAIVVSYWTDITPTVVITVSLVLILGINLINVLFFGEAEVISGAIKVSCFIGLIFTSIIITTGGGPSYKPIGFRYWNNPGAWTNFNGIPVPQASSSDSSLRLIVDPRNPDLVSGTGSANSSPWVIATRQAAVHALPSIVNACVVVSAWSAGNSYCWAASRMMVTMTTDGHLPFFFGCTNKQGVPYVGVVLVWLFGPLAYPSLGKGGVPQAFTWFQNLGTVGGLLVWATLCFCYTRFLAAPKIQGINRDTLPWKSPLQPYAAWYGFLGTSLITLITGFPVFLKGRWTTSDFIASYIDIPIYIVPIIV